MIEIPRVGVILILSHKEAILCIDRERTRALATNFAAVCTQAAAGDTTVPLA
jgi:hypothetical protein